MLKLWSPWQEWGLGVGDHLQVWGAVAAWQAANPGKLVICAHHGYESLEAVKHWPGVDFVRADHPPEEDYRNIWGASSGPPWWDWYATMGADWNDKRLYYWTTESERAYADMVWGSRRPRVLLQWSGGMAEKRYQHWTEVLHVMAQNVQANVIVSDWRDSGGSAGETARYGARWMPRCHLRLSLAIAATADLFIGFDSGPFYAAIGNRVPAVGIFPIKKADWLYWPVREPLTVPLEAYPCDAVPPKHIAWSALQLLAGAKPGEGIEQFEEYRSPIAGVKNPR